MTSLTASALLDTQASLLQEAAEALPHSFSQCTHHLGYIRQAVYLCQTCGEQRGICSACSIACHTDHEQLELFPKRKFRCDCPTAALAWKCTLHKPSPGKEVEDINTENKYSHNFRGTFCRCGRTYDAKVEMETMIQCVSCEVRLVGNVNAYADTNLVGLVPRVVSQLERTANWSQSRAVALKRHD